MNQRSWGRIGGFVGAVAVSIAVAMMANQRTTQTTASAAPPEPPAANTNQSNETVTESKESKTAVATLAGGCFWCTEAVFERMEGVLDVVSGYIGGQIPNPTYQAVCSGLTGHAEAIEIKYDPAKTSFEQLLEVFFATHDPTTLNRQGADVGTQYRSAIFFHDDQQKEIAQAYIKQLNESPEFKRRPIVTTLEPASIFYVAEEYHQDYFRRNPAAGYCQAVVRPKVMKFQKQFKDQVKKD
jgi:peptide-methionine (S)-S-oxide reductase